MPAQPDDEPPPAPPRNGGGSGLPPHLARFTHLGSESDLRARSPSPEPWSDSEVPVDEETSVALLRPKTMKHRKRRRLKAGWVTLGRFKIPLPLLILLLCPPLVIIIALLVRFPGHLPHRDSLPIISNGTRDFHPTTLVVSIDGFRPDYLETHDLSHIKALGDAGLRAKSMQPIFPTLTFPNHWAMLTGLYAESHGIVANDFWAPDINEGFSSRRKSSWNAEWWWGEPMWSVVERGGRRAAQMMWPGPPTTSAGISPSYFVPFKRETPPLDKLPQILQYLDMDIDQAPSLILTYLPDVDVAGHKGGPDSEDVAKALKRVDSFVGALTDSLETRNLSAVVDLIVLSDHGMMATSKERLVFLDDILGDGFGDLEHRDGWPSFGLRFKEGAPTDRYYEALKLAADTNGTFAVYTHDTMPERWHFNHGDRVAPVYLMPDLGWIITDHDEYDSNHDKDGNLVIRGAHGFDNTFPQMQAVFFARGPWAESIKAAAPNHADKWESTSPAVLKRKFQSVASAAPGPDMRVIQLRDFDLTAAFRNLELFNLIMRLQGLEKLAPPNNGTEGFWDKYL